MGIPNIHSASTPTSPLISSLATPQCAPPLLIGELTIQGRCYTVSIESSELLLSSPTDDTIKETKEKIEYLVQLYLEGIKSEWEGKNSNDFSIKQLDEDGLVYSTRIESNDWEEKTVSSSKINIDLLNPFDSKFSLPSSLERLSLTNIREVFRSIMDPLIAKKNEQKKETSPPIPPRSNKKVPLPHVIFTPNSEEGSIINPENMNPSKSHTPKIENRRMEESPSTIPKQVVEEDQSNPAEEQDLSKQSNKGWGSSWFSWLSRMFSRSSNSYEVTDSLNEIHQRAELFLEQHPEVTRFKDISNFQ